MAENSDNLSLGNFSIQDTVELMGATDLANSLLDGDSATANPDDVTPLEKDKEKDKKKPAVTTDKSTTKAPQKTKEEEEEELRNSLSEEEDDSNPEGKTIVEEKDKDESGEENKFTALAKDLFNLGVFSKDEGEEDVEIATPEELLERFNLEGRKKANEAIDTFIGQFGEDYQNAFQAIYIKGVNPKEYFGAYNNIQDFSALDLKVETNQVAVLQQVFHDQGMEPADITAEIERIKNYGDLETVAQRNHKLLVKKETERLAKIEKDSETRLQQATATKNQYVKNVNTVLQNKLKDKEFDGIPLNPKLAQELQDYLVVDKYKTPSGETLTEFDKAILELKRPENHERKVKIALLLKILEKDPTLSTIQKAAVTKKTDTLFSEVTRTGKATVKEKEKDKPVSWFSKT